MRTPQATPLTARPRTPNPALATTPRPPEVHTLAEAAALLRVRRSWLERQAAARKIPFTMLGGTYHFTAEHLRTIVQLHEVTPIRQETPAPAAPRARRTAPRPQVPDIAPLRARPRTGPRRAA